MGSIAYNAGKSITLILIITCSIIWLAEKFDFLPELKRLLNTTNINSTLSQLKNE